MDLEPLMLTKEVARLLRMKTNSVRKLAKRGLKPHPMIKGRYRREDVEAFLRMGAETQNEECQRSDEIPETSHGRSSTDEERSDSVVDIRPSSTARSSKESPTMTRLMKRIGTVGGQSKNKSKAKGAGES